jgi:flavin reductase (DIM6/NTAB) family NADH-FMN oxidoreductase RutF
MKNIGIGEAQRLTAPAPFGLLSVKRPDGRTNLMAISWWTYLTNHPPMIGVCLSKKGLSGELIRGSGEFALNIVGCGLAERALKCGQCSGRTVDKAEQFEIPLVRAEQIGAEIVSGSRVTFECRLAGSFDVGDHTMYLGEIAVIHADEDVKQLFAYDGYDKRNIL